MLLVGFTIKHSRSRHEYKYWRLPRILPKEATDEAIMLIGGALRSHKRKPSKISHLPLLRLFIRQALPGSPLPHHLSPPGQEEPPRRRLEGGEGVQHGGPIRKR